MRALEWQARCRSRAVRHFVSTVILTCCILPLQCATLERLTLDDMIQKSTAIVRAKVTDSFAQANGPLIFTHYTLQVGESFKGPKQTQMDVAVPGGEVNHLLQSFAGAPEFSVGGEYVFFLWTGKTGVTQVIGLTQGVFTLAGSTTADPLATRAASRELMLERGTGRPVKDQAIVMRMSDLRTRISTALGTAAQGGK